MTTIGRRFVLALSVLLCSFGPSIGAEATAAISAVSLQPLIDATPDGGTLTLSEGTYLGPATVGRPMAIVGAGADRTTIDGQGQHRCLLVTAGGVTLRGVRLANGRADYGAAVRGQGRPLLTDLEDCVVENCTATASGGGCFLCGRLRNCTFRGCRAERTGGAVEEALGAISGCLFEGNSAEMYGGACSYCSVPIENCVFRRNATSSVGGYGGGALRNCPNISRCVFEGNSSVCEGGAVANQNGSGCRVEFSLFVGNDSSAAGGAVHRAECYSCTFVSNTVNGATDHGSSGVSSGSTAFDCLFYACRSEATMNCSHVASSDPFTDLAHGSYLVNPMRSGGLQGDAGRGDAYVRAGTRDLAGRPVLSAPFFVAGCYALLLTLQDLIDMTPAGGVCRLPAGTYAGPGVINKRMTLTADDPEKTIIDGGGTKRCLEITSSDVTVSNIGFENGYTGSYGGGIWVDDNKSNLVISNCRFRNCRTGTEGSGGALHNVNGRIEDCLFEGNSAGYGGAACYGKTFWRCVFRSNRALYQGGALFVGEARFSLFAGNGIAGGGSKMEGGACLGTTCYSCTFSDNTVDGSTAAATSGAGGNATVCDCLFYNCKCASTKDNSYVAEGDPFIDRAGGDYHLNMAARAAYPGAAGRFSDYKGNGTLYLDGVKVADFTKFPAGCYSPLSELQLLINATPAGGTCEVPAGTYDPATVPAGKDGIKIVGVGGASVVDGDGSQRCLLVRSKNVTLSGLRFVNGFAGESDRNGDGGGVLEDSGAVSLTASNCTFEACVAGCHGGGVGFARALKDCAFADCRAGYEGGGAYTTELTEDCTFDNCSSGRGGGVKNKARIRDSAIRNCRFTGCEAVYYGGGVQCEGREGPDGTDNGVLDGCVFTECRTTTYDGGGCDNVKTVTNCTFVSCSAKRSGGGLQSVSCLSDCAFAGCRAETEYGGGAQNVLYVERCRFEECSAAKNGGGLDNASEVWSSLFLNNACGWEGGGANYAVKGAVGCVNCTFVGNTCGSGKATEAIGNMPSVRNCLFYLNDAPDAKRTDGNYAVTNRTAFYDATRRDYHLRCGSTEAERLVAHGADGGRRDLDGVPLANEVAGTRYYFSGCYAFVPSDAKGLEVNVADDVLRPETAALTSLREALDDIAARPERHLGPDGRCAVKFAPALFADADTLVVPLERAQMTVDCPLPVTLAPPAGKRLVLDGDGCWRALYVAPGSRLLLSEVAVSNCLAVSAGAHAAARMTSGGAIVNDGALVASNCVFACNAAGGGSALMPAPTGGGGALLNRGDAVFERCTFVGNSAANGGAVCNTATGRFTAVCSTFAGNRAIRGNSTVGSNGGNGGAIAQITASGAGTPDSLLVNCTITGNAADGAGGAIYAQGTAGLRSLALADVIAVGNVGEYDLYLQEGVGTEAVATLYGSRNAASSGGWNGTSSEGGKSADDLFADVTADGSAALPTTAANGQVTFPLLNGLSHPSVWVRHNGDWSYAGCAADRSSADWPALRDATAVPPRQQRDQPLLEQDQLGNRFARPPLGATAVTKPRTFGPDVPPEDDPRILRSTDPADIAARLAAVNSKADELARGGVVTVSFDPSVTGRTVFADHLLGTLTGFTNALLVIKGPITLDGGGQTHFFTIGAGNAVEFRDVTFVNGRDEGAGGAIQGVHCALACTRCEFRGCSAPYGGAVCLDYADSRGLFTDCVFEDNAADASGHAIYNDGCELSLVRTRIRPEDVYERLRAVVEHSPRQIAENPACATPDSFSSTADAVRTLEGGCTLVLLSPDAEKDLDLLEIPAGVTVVRRFARIVDGTVVVEGGGDSLREGIAMAMSGNVRAIRLYPGRYAPATVPAGLDGLVVSGSDPLACVIDGELADAASPCFGSSSANVTVSNLTFSAGRADGDGGGVRGVKTVVHCFFDDCAASGRGGAVAGDGWTVVKLSLFRNCVAPTGAAVSRVTALGCTFVDENASGQAVEADSSLVACFAAGGTFSRVQANSYSTDDPAADFVQPGADYALKVASLGKYPADDAVALAQREGWTDAFGRPLVVSIAGRDRLFAGAFAPEMPDQRLQAMIDAAEPGGVVEIPEGTYGPATVPSAKGAITLRPASGAKVTVNGLGLGPALTVEGAATVEGLTITGGSASRGGGVYGAGSKTTVRSCLIAGNAAEVSGGGVIYVTAVNCTFVGNVAKFGSAASDSDVRASVGATADQTLSSCTPVDWFTAAEADFTDFARGDYTIPEANWPRFAAADADWVKVTYASKRTDLAGRPTVRRRAGEYVGLAGAYAADLDDTLQRLIDFAEGDRVEVPDGSYAPVVVERDGITVIHPGEPTACTVNGAGRWRGACVTGAGVTIEGLTFADCAADEGGGVRGTSPRLAIRNCVFTGCTADVCGGALFATNDAVVTGCSFTGSSATNLNSSGGAVYAANALVAGCLFRGNSAVRAGALVAGENVRTICCTFAGNTATGSAYAGTASAAFAMSAGLTLADCVLFGDTQTGFGTEGRTLAPTADPFVASGAGDWRLRSDLFVEAVDSGDAAAGRIAALHAAGAVMPDGRSLVSSMADESVLFSGACGLAASNGLQELIDRASPGQELAVEDGEYLPAVIPEDKSGLTLAGAGAAVIDGRGLFRCLTVRAGGVTLKGLTFANGVTAGEGGGVWGERTVSAVVDCTFTNCTAGTRGGGVSGVREIRGCRFIANRAGTEGGGASQETRDVVGSLFALNEAGSLDAVSHQTGDAAGRFDHCTLYANASADAATDCPEGNFNLNDADAGKMVDPAGGDFRIRAEFATASAVEDCAWATNALAHGWIGADGASLARAAGDWAVMTRGAINCWDMTLQSAVDGAPMGEVVEVGDGTYPPLFVGSRKNGVIVRAKEGACVTIDGAGRFRGVTDASQGLTLEGLVITNGLASAYGDFGPNGGGYCGVPGNGARLVGCTVAGCSAPDASGGGVYGAQAVIGSKLVGNVSTYGGGVAGTALVRTSLLFGNRVAGATGGFGGGVYGRLGNAGTAVMNCTFADNVSDRGATAAGLYEGADIHNLFSGCGRAGVTNSTGQVASEPPFVNAAAGDWRLANDRLRQLAVTDFDYAAIVRSEGWTSPDGDPLALRVVGADIVAAGAYGPDLDLRLQQWVDAAKPGDTVYVPTGVYAPVTVDVGDIALVATGATGTCVIECAGLYRGVTVRMPGVTVCGLSVRNGDMAVWTGSEDIDCTGGAIRGDGSTTVASNCTFTGCRALHGGATAGMGLVSGCSYLRCAAQGYGGGSYGDRAVRCSLFAWNAAETNGAASALSALTSCTVVSNAVTDGETAWAGSAAYSVFCGNAAAEGTGNLATNEDFFAEGGWRPTDEAAATNLIDDAAFVAAAVGWTDPEGRRLVFVADGALAMTVGAYAPSSAVSPSLPPVAERTVIRLTRPTGETVRFESAAEAAQTLRSGGFVEVESLGADDVEGSGKTVEEAFLALQAQLLAAVREAVRDRPWYSVWAEGSGVRSSLNGLAAPKLDEDSQIDMACGGTEVSVVPSNVQPELWYGLGCGGTPEGPYVVPEDGWVQADADGRLPRALTSPKPGARGFYRVFVSDGRR